MSNVDGTLERMLLMDTCGEGAGVAVSVGEQVVARVELPRGGGSAEIVNAVERVLSEAGCVLGEMSAIGVVSGPGSFTGVRVGMAAAKGFAEAVRVRMIAVSRLEILAEAAGRRDGWVVLDAGRGEVYALEVAGGVVGGERLAGSERLLAAAKGLEVVVAEERLAARLQEEGVHVRLRPLSVNDALRPILRVLRSGAAEMSLDDANYVRRETDIYPAKTVAVEPPKDSAA